MQGNASVNNNIEIKEYTSYNPDETFPLYKSVGWTNYTDNPKMLENAYNNSLKSYAAYDNEKLIGIIRIVGDGSSIILIQDILIYPDYQRLGIGTRLIKHILNEFKDVYQIQLVTDNIDKTKAFYKSLGFNELADIGCTGFMI